MSAITDGPWIADGPHILGPHGCTVAAAYTGVTYANGGTCVILTESAIANAKVMAAAPELLAAAQGVVEMEDEPRFLYEAIRDLRAAIAKATGEGA